ncbi:MAG: DNA polymerase III subunit beta [Bacteroidia bacterium]|nr:DNA polymerase III subunit beta [Bacteroidia bacterium]
MRFIISSGELIKHLQTVSKVISTKNTLPILDNFLFRLSKDELTVTASDLETTFITTIKVLESEEEGSIAIEAKRLNDIIKEFPEQPLTFKIDHESMKVEILSDKGVYNVMGQNSDDFPELPVLNEELTIRSKIKSEILNTGISKTIFATADDELRPVMNGIFIELSVADIGFVASDAHKLIRYKRSDNPAEATAAFILPKKPASLIKNILAKDINEVQLEFDKKNAFFTLPEYRLICRLVEGNYPNYNSVIPLNNPNKLTIDRMEIYNTIKRVSVFSNQASNLIKLHLTANQIIVSAQDIDYSISAIETLTCQYDGDEMEIGFKSIFLLELLANISTAEVRFELSDPSRAGILLPVENETEGEDILMLLMPMMINV